MRTSINVRGVIELLELLELLFGALLIADEVATDDDSTDEKLAGSDEDKSTEDELGKVDETDDALSTTELDASELATELLRAELGGFDDPLLPPPHAVKLSITPASSPI